jgi:pyruvate kinase
MTPDVATSRRMVLSWGVHCVHAPQTIVDVPDMVARACDLVRGEGFGAPGAPVLVAAGMPFGTVGTTNFLHFAKA